MKVADLIIQLGDYPLDAEVQIRVDKEEVYYVKIEHSSISLETVYPPFERGKTQNPNRVLVISAKEYE